MEWSLIIAVISAMVLALVGIVALGVWLMDESPKPAGEEAAAEPSTDRPSVVGLPLD